MQNYIKYGEENALNDKWMKPFENASAKYHISKYEALKIRVQQSIEKMYAKQEKTLASALEEAYKSGCYHTAFELQKGFNIGFDISAVDQSQLEKILSKPRAADGVNFSNRIRNNKSKLISELHNELTRET
ncbi:MAG: hypothetical protein LUC97_11110 [Clostridiales bacterium]|nr:hypothetical protein [Clostridiales bacterium]